MHCILYLDPKPNFLDFVQRCSIYRDRVNTKGIIEVRMIIAGNTQVILLGE